MHSMLNLALHVRYAFINFGMFIDYSFYVSHLRLQILIHCCILTEQQKTESQHFPSRHFIQRRPGPSTMVPSKSHVSNSITNQLASMNAMFTSTQSQALLQGHSLSTPSTTASGSSSNSNSASRPSISEMSGHSNVGPGNENQMA